MKPIFSLGSVLLLSLLGCASHEKPTVNHNPTEWDYKKIEEVRDAENAQTPTTPSNPRDDAMCQVYTHEQMVRSKAHGCHRLDPRQGHGPDAWCCSAQ